MQDNKFFYKGIPITEYCREHNIRVGTIRGRIWKKLHNKKYDNYSFQEIVDMVIESYGTSVKYMYKGISLRQYCLNNNINVATINSRISLLKKNNPSLTNEELVTLAMDEFEKYTDKYIIDFFKRKFEIININEKVYEYFKERFNNKNLFNSELIIITRGKTGADFIYNDKIIKKRLIPTKVIDPNGAGDAFFSSIIYDFFIGNFTIDSAFNNATKLTSIVVSSLGARGHLHDIYKIEKIDNKCICTDFKIKRGE